MKCLYEVKTRTQGHIDRARVIIGFRRAKELREVFANTIRIARKQRISGIGNALEGLRDAVRQARNAAREEIDKISTFTTISRTIRGKRFEVVKYPDSSYQDILRDLKERIRTYRRDNKRPHYAAHMHYFPNEILNQLLRRRLNKRKSPKDKSQYIGIELECVTPRGLDLQKLLPFADYIDIGSDGSIQYGENENGTEVRVCLRRDEVRKVLPPLLKTLKELGAKVNRSCGLHVHLDQRNNANVASAYQKLVRSQGLLYTIVPPSRKANDYCRRSRNYDFDRARYGNRYRAINATAYGRYNTLEVRLFGGTLNATKVCNWVETLIAISEGENILRCPRNFDLAARHWKLSDENLTWLKARQALYAAPTPPQDESITEEVA